MVTDLLKERYGDSQTVINSHYVDLINLRAAQNTPRGLRSLYDLIEQHLRSLQTLKQEINQDVFISMITSKLPKEVLIQLEIQEGTCNKWTVKEMRQFSKITLQPERELNNSFAQQRQNLLVNLISLL